MVQFAVFCPPFTSHLRALETLAGSLIDAGHAVAWVAPIDVLNQLTDPRIDQLEVGRGSHPAGSIARIVERAAHPAGPWGLRRVIHDMTRHTDMLCTEGLQVLRQVGAQVLIVDEMEAAGALLATSAGLPWISVACALPLNREPRIPLPVMHWALADDAAALQRNAVSERVHDWLMGSHSRAIARLCGELGVARRASLVDCLSPLLQLSQTTADFDFPRTDAPPHLVHVGPLRRRAASASLDLPLRNDRPFVFASLGTLQGGRFGLFRRIARACRSIGAQLLVAHCGWLNDAQCRALARDGATWVTDFAPQRAVLVHADVCVTHGGLNTVLDALEAGTPMLALPIAFDQPGVAARLVHAGAGLRLLPALATTSSIERALTRLLREPSYCERAAALGAGVAHAGGALGAVAAIERALGLPAGPAMETSDAA